MPDISKSTDLTGETAPAIHVSPSPHILDTGSVTTRVMLDVVISLIPVIAVSVFLFKLYAIKQILLCTVSCLVAEFIFEKMRGKSITINDFSAAVTGIILAFSLPPAAPWYATVIGAFAAIGLGKVLFGGVGMNIFNPAMVGRAFAIMAFTQQLGSSAYENLSGVADAVSGATPLTALKYDGVHTALSNMILGNTAGSLGETSVIACILGGLYPHRLHLAAAARALGSALAVAQQIARRRPLEQFVRARALFDRHFEHALHDAVQLAEICGIELLHRGLRVQARLE